MKKIFTWFGYFGMTILAIVIVLIAPIDKSPLHDQSFYKTMMNRLDTIRPTTTSSRNKLKVGWSKFNITPSYSMPMAGYTPKDRFESIHDSVYCRVLSIENELSSNFIISIDLMLFPPVVKERVNEELKKQGKDYFVYFAATHTHSSIGGWDPSLVGRFTLGSYHAEWVDKTVQEILTSMEKAKSSSQFSSIGYWETDASEYVENRLDGTNGKVDGRLRGLKFIRSDSSKGVVVTYSAHPTSVELLSRIISGDYPTALTNHLEKSEFEFGMFLAGMVGSHRLKGFDGNDFEKIENTGRTLSEKVIKASTQKLPDSVLISSAHIPIQFGASQLRIANNWKIRDWAFRSAINPLKGELTVLKIENIVLIGTPCDFSGEIFVNQKIDLLAESLGEKIIVTSFNGNYTGYTTADQYYEKGGEEEVMALNWTGPYFGEYYSTMIKKILTSDF